MGGSWLGFLRSGTWTGGSSRHGFPGSQGQRDGDGPHERGTLLDNEHSLEPFDPRVIAMIGKHGGWFAAE